MFYFQISEIIRLQGKQRRNETFGIGGKTVSVADIRKSGSDQLGGPVAPQSVLRHRRALQDGQVRHAAQIGQSVAGSKKSGTSQNGLFFSI